MRLWSLHPCYLDTKGLTALWREGLLAQQVLQGNTRGYTNHPQLLRFKKTPDPLGAIAYYLNVIVDEADNRGYSFTREKIAKTMFSGKITVTNEQVHYEFSHLLSKLKKRAPKLSKRFEKTTQIRLHPLFELIKGPIESWEKVWHNYF